MFAFYFCLLQVIASKDLENWALIQPGGDTLNLKIKVEMEEKLYLRQILASTTVVKPVNPTTRQLGSMKAIKLTFSDKYTTQVVFHIKRKKPKKVGSLRQLSALVASDSLKSLGEAAKMAEDGFLPGHLVPDLEAAWTNCWTQRLVFIDTRTHCSALQMFFCLRFFRSNSPFIFPGLPDLVCTPVAKLSTPCGRQPASAEERSSPESWQRPDPGSWPRRRERLQKVQRSLKQLFPLPADSHSSLKQLFPLQKGSHSSL